MAFRRVVRSVSRRAHVAPFTALETRLQRRDVTFSSMQPHYRYRTSLYGHNSPITALSFSFDGNYLAAGSENGTLVIYAVTSWVPLLRFVDLSPLTSIAWHPSKKRVLFCGFESGDVHTLMLPRTEVSAAP